MSTTRLLHMGETAGKLMREIEPLCVRQLVCGSLRRGSPNPKDVEIVVEAKVKPVQGALFGGSGMVHNPLPARLSQLEQMGELRKRPRSDGKTAAGERYWAIEMDGVAIDLFMVLPPAQWGVIATIRTGPADFSKMIVQDALKQGLRFKDGAIWRGEELIPTPEEADVFRALNMRWVAPEARR